MAKIKAADVAKLRKMTGAGMMDCKKALGETDGNFDEAIDLLRKKGQKIAAKRADKDALEGVVLAKSNDDKTKAVIISLNCETDFVAKTENFINLSNTILEVALTSGATNLEELNNAKIGGKTISEEILESTGIIGEKMQLSHFSQITADKVEFYIHQDKKLSTMVGFNKTYAEDQVGKDVAMQIAAMNPAGIDKDDVAENIVKKELEIGKELAINEGKPEKLAEQISKGRLNKFFKENTLLNQSFIKDNKKTVSDYLKGEDKDLTVTVMKRHSIREM